MTVLFDYPRAAAFGRVLPKIRVYEHAGASTKLRQLFVDQVDQIVWQYKLATDTINLDPTDAVSEIQVFRLRLRTSKYSEDVLRAIDKAISFPIIFELSHGRKLRTTAAYKRPSEADRAKWVVSEYLSGEWESEDKPRKPLPRALNLGALYDRILNALIPEGIADTEPVAARVERIELIRAKQREAQRIKARLVREKQFNKRVAINAELREVTKELKRLGGAALAKE